MPLLVDELNKQINKIRNVDTPLYLPPGGLCPPDPSLPTVLYYQATVVFDLTTLSPRAWHGAEHDIFFLGGCALLHAQVFQFP